MTLHPPAITRTSLFGGIGKNISRSLLMRLSLFSLILLGGGAHKHFWVFHLRQYAVFTPLSIERRVVPAAAPNRRPAGRRSVLSLAGSRSDKSLPSAQPEPAETRYPHCHVFRLTIWNNTEEDTRTERHKSSHVRDELGVRERSLFPSDEPRGV